MSETDLSICRVTVELPDHDRLQGGIPMWDTAVLGWLAGNAGSVYVDGVPYPFLAAQFAARCLLAAVDEAQRPVPLSAQETQQ